MATVVTLTTDFGLVDAYVAAMKGVILSINPEVRLVDICHLIKPQNILQAAFVLSTAYQFFPRRTVHLVVVDPGVGSGRRALIVRTPSADFVAPDNGVLSYVLQQFLSEPEKTGINPQQRKLKSEVEAVAITKSQFWRLPVSPTFHGRDIFAPVAALLSLGSSPRDFGETVTSVLMLPLSHTYQQANGTLVGHILHVDNFGNLITDIRSDDLPQKKQEMTIEVGRQRILGLSRNYNEGRGLSALIGSSGYLEISLKGGNACALLDAEIGNEVKIREGGSQ
jgi:hypothetical protein